MSIVRENLLNVKNYSPYCGNDLPRNTSKGCDNPRTKWSKERNQFYCPHCFWVSAFDDEFIKQYKTKWNV